MPSQPNTQYKLVLFDLGRVLVNFDQDKIAQRLMERAHRTFEDIIAFYRTTQVFHNFECGTISPEDTLALINKMLGAEMSMEEFKPLWSDIFVENEGMAAIVDALGAHYRLFVLSDTNVLHYEHICERFPIMKKFETHILSFKVGARKPDRRMYEAALRHAGVSAEETVFIDDKEKNITGARALGITAVHYQSVAETKKAFQSIGLMS